MFDRSRTLSAAIVTAMLAFVVSAFAADSKRDATRSESFRGIATTNPHHVFSGHRAQRLRHKTTRPRARHHGRRDKTAPDTAIIFGPSGTIPVPASAFAFSASERKSTFECRLDEGDWHACSSPEPVSGMTEGPHTFAVRATDRKGNTDPTPAVRSFAVDLPSIPPDEPDQPDPPDRARSARSARRARSACSARRARSACSARRARSACSARRARSSLFRPTSPIRLFRPTSPIRLFRPTSPIRLFRQARLRSSPAPERWSPRTWPPSRTRA